MFLRIFPFILFVSLFCIFFIPLSRRAVAVVVLSLQRAAFLFLCSPRICHYTLIRKTENHMSDSFRSMCRLLVLCHLPIVILAWKSLRKLSFSFSALFFGRKRNQNRIRISISEMKIYFCSPFSEICHSLFGRLTFFICENELARRCLPFAARVHVIDFEMQRSWILNWSELFSIILIRALRKVTDQIGGGLSRAHWLFWITSDTEIARTAQRSFSLDSSFLFFKFYSSVHSARVVHVCEPPHERDQC